MILQVPPIPFLESPLFFQLLGAVLAIIGGFFAVIVRLRLETKQEIIHIKISLIDEVMEIHSIIDKLKETYRTTNIFSNIYLNDLLECTKSFDFHRQKFYLIKNDLLRRKIILFYKELNELVSESINKVNTLGVVQQGSIDKFNELNTKAVSLKQQIEEFKYRVFWIC